MNVYVFPQSVGFWYNAYAARGQVGNFRFAVLTTGCCCPRKGAFLLFYAIDLLVCHSVFSEDCLVGCTLEILSEQERVQCHLRGRNPYYSKRVKEPMSILCETV